MVRPRVATALGLLSTAALASATYTQTDNYDKNNFFQKFEFFSGPDPTNGHVQYADSSQANNEGLAGFSGGGVYLGVDHTSNVTTGRPSTRVTSTATYTKGLFIADIAHMPAGTGQYGSCGLWPAFWMFGPNWPNGGEIDILEGVNNQASNEITLHTAAGCSMTNPLNNSVTTMSSQDCQGNTGCPQVTNNPATYGSAFNAAGGGVYAVEWTSTAISVWFFSRSDPMVASLTNNANPDPATFGTPLAQFAGNGGCDIDQHFANHQIVFNIDFCGDWAGNVFDSDPTCKSTNLSCNDYVGQNPEAFVEAYWLINSVKVFQQTGTPAVKKARRFKA
ncbi:hypothetical protein DL546_002034 [Coniochaeta pulveracea]|uniref:endo-1,3(4)-beta-glucanase n=1 Tax=Coniochaeta pulveracea TaxID=177199 RepID=A0A420XX79_9PEZI|nr:hypothetical protein DL546_002034 [Coniochaeta pulveracea]